MASATRSPAARAKAGSARAEDGLPACSLADLIAELGTICRNRVRIADGDHTFQRTTEPNEIQAKALALLGVKLVA